MRTVGLIVEYNPFHNGHLYHLRQSRKITEAEAVVAVMSGHFLQRGEPALLDKWTRTRMALAGGCDLVIELPCAYATQAAEWFAFGAVSLLEATGVVDAFCFGTESGELAPLLQAAELTAKESPEFKAILKRRLQDGGSYPGAYSAAVSDYLAERGHASAANFPFAMPNHTLGLHYLIALNRIGGTMKPYTIAREKAQYNQTTATDSRIASATAIRKMLLEERTLEAAGPYVPESTYRFLREEWLAGRCPVSWDNYARPLLHAIVTRSAEQLAELRELNEGLEHRIRNALPKLDGLRFEELLEALKTKRYTRTKLQRALLSVLLGHAKADFTAEKLAAGVEYIRVLGFTGKGRQLLRRMRDAAALPVLLSAARPPRPYPYLELDVRATGAYMLDLPGGGAAPALFRDFTDKPVAMP
ncbi:nucleotidyltransferase [Paenibacillus arenilitoris]|uniref:tRNA(Met) cytidine acetate ligase n=1 Tax=Paenibacillus arenilitoris TaxID=2772299 RepID=A0A927H6P5_9BACL|nr:nucleotidyltransferase [Paenibacillus arenilitoris]MBD2870781.1 nucleotidyltransferase [Paenibacillus arenilitoris]